jgi:Ca-activated chloride channel homolog
MAEAIPELVCPEVGNPKLPRPAGSPRRRSGRQRVPFLRNLPVRLMRWIAFFLSLCCAAAAQIVSFPSSIDSSTSMGAIRTGQLDFNMFLIGTRNPNVTEVQGADSSISTLDLKAPAKARRNYEQGYKLLMGNDLQGAVAHFALAVAIYPNFVAAHDALGSAYLKLGRNLEAESEFTHAIALDGHLPNSYLNLGCARLALQQFPGAEESLRKASSLAPLDVQLKLALSYAEFANRDYSGVIATEREVHAGKHDGAAVVHLFAAGAWEAQGNLEEAQGQMETLLQEYPHSPSLGKFQQILAQIESEETRRTQATLHPTSASTQSSSAPAGLAPEEAARRQQQYLQETRQMERQEKEEESQVAEAEAAPDPTCLDCITPGTAGLPEAPDSISAANQPGAASPGATLHINVDEASVLFAATYHGKSVIDLAASDIAILDDGKPPAAILGFRNESQLPLRLGLVIDTSESVTGRFSFEQAAATRFLQEMNFGRDDLGFLVGVNNFVLLAQDFTADATEASRAMYQLVPGGGTALWDAVAFAADKLAGRPEAQPVARILVVISDGSDNSSSVTLKQAIAHAQRGGVAVYTISTSDCLAASLEPTVGDRALSALADLTGGAAFMPCSASHLNGSFADLQQIIRSRYLLSYAPASFEADGMYRTIDLEAQKDGHKLRVFARKGYYASVAPQAPHDH